MSGINNAANLGDDVIYSGTVAAAMEGRFLGLPAVAVSLATADHKGRHYETAARAAVEIIAAPAGRPAAGRHHPQRQRARPAVGRDRAGSKSRRLGNRHRAEPCIPQQDPRGRQWWWIGPAGRRAGRRPRHRFPRGAQRPHLDHPDPRRPDALPGAGTGRQLGRRPGASLLDARERAGMTAAHAPAARSDRPGHDLAARARPPGRAPARRTASATNACSTRSAPCRATCSSTKRWPRAPTRTPRCRSATARPSRSRGWWRR